LIVILLRIVACMTIIALPFALLAIASGKAEGLIWLMFPIVFAIPALALLALVFVPVETLAGATGLSRNVAVISAGALGGAFIWLALRGLQATAQGKPLASVFDPLSLKLMLVWAVLGALLGCLWRLSEWLARSFGWIGHG
jgi:hypothetical protein